MNSRRKKGGRQRKRRKRGVVRCRKVEEEIWIYKKQECEKEIKEGENKGKQKKV